MAAVRACQDMRVNLLSEVHDVVFREDVSTTPNMQEPASALPSQVGHRLCRGCLVLRRRGRDKRPSRGKQLCTDSPGKPRGPRTPMATNSSRRLQSTFAQVEAHAVIQGTMSVMVGRCRLQPSVAGADRPANIASACQFADAALGNRPRNVGIDERPSVLHADAFSPLAAHDLMIAFHPRVTRSSRDRRSS